MKLRCLSLALVLCALSASALAAAPPPDPGVAVVQAADQVTASAVVSIQVVELRHVADLQVVSLAPELSHLAMQRCQPRVDRELVPASAIVALASGRTPSRDPVTYSS
ncbi:MAG: hypothetical protein NT117_00045 [Gammaproteobacteria bacterium]|nr:hypothetical protein [Gammaproteobacteria bacterium]